MKKVIKVRWLVAALIIVILAAGVVFSKTVLFKSEKAKQVKSTSSDIYEVPRAVKAPVVDGDGKDKCWEKASWVDINYLWGGSKPESWNFSGRYKMVWTPKKLYYLIDITDDQLYDAHPFPFDNADKDDCLTLYVDEDHSGGFTKNNYNTLKYYIDIHNFASTIGVGYRPFCLNNHMVIKRQDMGSQHMWEIGLNIYNDKYSENGHNVPVTLHKNKIMGYALGYIDNDDGVLSCYTGSYDRSNSHFNDKDPNTTAGSFNVLKLMP